MDYQKNLKVIGEMLEAYEKSPVIMYGLVGNWIPIYKAYAALFYGSKEFNDCKKRYS